MSIDVPDELGQTCPRCGVEVESATVIEGIGLVVWPCGHAFEP